MNTQQTSDPVVVVGTARTPIGAFQGTLRNKSAVQLGAAAIQAAVERSCLDVHVVSEVIMGNCLSAGLGQAPARQASLGGGLPLSAGCTTLSKMCGSGMKATMLAHDLLLAGSARVIVAGGMESMSNAPYLLPKVRTGLRLGHSAVKDHMFLDGLEDAYESGRLMGSFAEECASAYGFGRQDQDRFALTSLSRARAAIADRRFRDEIVPVAGGDGHAVTDDESPGTADPEKIPRLKPAFAKDGTITAANASSISDGAAALVLMRLSLAEQLRAPVRAIMRGHATYADHPAKFSTAPVPAIRSLLARVGWQIADVGLFEINEAFAVVTMAAMRDLDIPHDKVNVHGGACALGHPIGATGARLLVTLLSAMEQYDVKRGVAALCIGGGEATAVALERM